MPAAPEQVAQGCLAGRTIQEVADLSLQEQLYLYERTRQFKAKKHTAQGGSQCSASKAPPLCEVQDANEDERMDNHDSTVYLLFMEGSTRTRESLRNAAVYHGVKVNEFQAESSSFQKNETITDAMKMLSVYSIGRSVFVLRSPLEGVCRWLQNTMAAHAERFGIPVPAFLNAGDGAYKHPLGEMVDIFSLLEMNNWDNSAVHLALVGDLAHGRTAHSKVDGLKVFGKVRIDLVAPELFGYPVEYKTRMRTEGFEVREFASVEEYMQNASGSVASTWYFYKPYFSKYGDLGGARKKELLSQVTFRSEWYDTLPQGAKFFQTLPRDKENPIIPLAFDSLPINGWDGLASNAYFLDVVLLGMLFGKIGRGLQARALSKSLLTAEVEKRSRAALLSEELGPGDLPNFIQAVDLSTSSHSRDPKRARAGGPVPITDGLVIDHICVSKDSSKTWHALQLVRRLMGWSNHIGSEGVAKKSEDIFKGIMALPGFHFESLNVAELKTLASIAPECTINCISGSKVVAKYRLQVPERIFSLPNISCKNVLCVSNPVNKQRDVYSYFERVPYYQSSVLPGCEEAEYLYVCKYCRWPHTYANIWQAESF